MKRALGYDSSYFDKWLKPDQESIPVDFLILRTGYGMMEDSIFQQSAREVGTLKAVKMVYHYFSSGSPWKEQVERHLEICGKAPWTPACHWIDFENAYNEMTMKFAEECLQAIEYLLKLDKKAGIYTNLYLYNHYFGPAAGEKQYPLWLSWPIDSWEIKPDIHKYRPILPNLRDDWDFWQYSFRGNGTEYGAGRTYAFDLDVFHGSPAELQAWQQPTQEIGPKDLFKEGYDLAIKKVTCFLNSIK